MTVLSGAVLPVVVIVGFLSQALVELGCAWQRRRRVIVVREPETLAVCGLLSLIMLGAYAVALGEPPERQHLAWVVLAAFLARDLTKAVYRHSRSSSRVTGPFPAVPRRAGSSRSGGRFSGADGVDSDDGDTS